MERIKQTIDDNQRVSLEKLNTKMLYFPQFNEDQRDKWITAKGFSLEGFKELKVAKWNEIHNSNPEGIEPY
jgi:hypothetical protein